MGFKIAKTPLAYTPTGSTEATDHPDDNLTRWTRPFLTWRTTSASGSVVGDLGSPKTLKGVFLNNANFPTVTVEVSSASDFSSDVTALSTGVAVPQDARVANRRKGWLDYPSNVLSKRYVRITPGGTPDGGAGYYELGVASFYDAVVELADSAAWPLAWTPAQAHTATPFLSGGREINEDGPIYLEWAFENPHWKRKSSTIMAELLDLLGAGIGATPVIWENLGNAAHAYLLQRVDQVGFTERFATFEARFPFAEAI